MVACKPMWQNLRAYQTIANNPSPHINAELLLVSTQYSYSYNSQNECFWTCVDMDIFSCFVTWNMCPIFVRIFQLHPVYVCTYTCVYIPVYLYVSMYM
jgi:hypothetical protein